MRVTPIDVIQKEFTPVKKGGLDPGEVRGFLDALRETLEEVLQENQHLKDLLVAREKEIATLRENEMGIKDTLLLARQLAADVRRAAHKEADVIIGESRIEAERIVASAHDEHRRSLELIMRLRGLRHQYFAQMHALLESQQRVLAELETSQDALQLPLPDDLAASGEKH